MNTPKTADQLRESFLKFFESKNHLILPSSSLIPSGDPTLLLTNSGMAQFKSYFSGEKKPPSKRITTSQKCFRTTDIEEVGDDTHLTLFEMLGNFSFGDYFKKEACEWALEFMTDVLKFDVNRIFFTIYKDDDETKKIWLDLGIPEKYIYKFGDEDNWWGPAGDEGPCGPCSELHYFTGDLNSMDFENNNWGPNIHEDFIELYNLVFTQFYREIDGKDTKLPFNNIDTGMGLERTISVLNKVNSAYETDIFEDHLKGLNKLVSKNIDNSDKYKRIIAEHGRSASFLIADGVLPENTGRGYVLRRLIRRAMVTAKKLKLEYPILSPIAEVTSSKLNHIYPELKEKLNFIISVLNKEEQNFNKTLSYGTQVLSELIRKRNKSFEDVDSSRDALDTANDIYNKLDKKEDLSILTGFEAFNLYDTYGFPIEITNELCQEAGIDIDKNSFKIIMAKQKDISKNSSQTKKNQDQKIYSSLNLDPTEFTGYTSLESDSEILGLIKNGKSVKEIKNNDLFELIIDKSPFYAEKGGQIGDSGFGRNDKTQLEILDTTSPYGGIFIHKAKLKNGNINLGNILKFNVDKKRREKIRRNHTATHLVHAALREIVGTHVRQSGSLVHDDYLRFDFTSLEALDRKTLKKIEDRVNLSVRENLEVEVYFTTYNKAIEEGALAFFDEKYEHEVRTIKIDAPWSFELCGGTHMSKTGGIGLFKILSENGIGSGNRRIFATTGVGTEQLVDEHFFTLNSIMKTLSTNNDDVIDKFNNLYEQSKQQQKEIESLQLELTNQSLGTRNNSINQEFSLSNTKISCSKVTASNIGSLRKAGDLQRTKIGKGIVILGSIMEQKGSIVIMATDNNSIDANYIAKIIAEETNGGGGGNKFSAQVGIKNISEFDKFFKNPKEILEKHIN
ncbi:MAG: alanine--tRNA ligase [Dehalococcoidales bacterium]|nr:alanine--tRNA ligase [Dehalococcoidales bacterium]